MMISGNLCDTFTYDPSVMTCFTHVLLKTLQELRMLSLSRSLWKHAIVPLNKQMNRFR